jgi:translation initiation factor IF-2
VVSVFVPTGNDPRDVAGRPAHYRVEPYGSFTVDQIANRGSWVGAGTFPVRDGRLSVTLLTRGANPDGEHLAAAQVRVSCTAL